MSELPPDLETEVVRAIADLPIAQDAQNRRSLLANIPAGGRLDCSGGPYTSIRQLVDWLKVFGPLEDGTPPLARFIQNALDTTGNSQCVPLLTQARDLLLESAPTPPPPDLQHLAALRQKYADPTRIRYQMLDLISLSEHEIKAEILRRAPDPRWTEVIRRAIVYIGTVDGQKRLATRLVQAILDRGDPYEAYLHRNLLLGGRVIADDPGVDPRLGEEIARRLWDLLMNTQVMALRDSAGEVLLEMLGTGLRASIMGWVEAAVFREAIGRLAVLTPDPAVRSGLLLLLTDPDPNVRSAAARALGSTASDPAIRAALLPLLDDPEWMVSLAAAGALGTAVSDPAALLPLLANPAAGVRQFAAELLGSAASDPAVRASLLLLLTDPDAGVRSAAARAVPSAASDPAVRAALLPLLADPDKDVRRATAGALGSATSHSAVRAALLPLLTDPDAGVRSAAAGALGSAASDPVVRASLLLLLTDPDAGVRSAAAGAVPSAASDPAVRAALLFPLLADPNAGVRQAAVRALGTAASDPAIRAALLPLLADPEWTVSMTAVLALSTAASDPAVRAALLPLLDDSDGFVLLAVVHAFSNAPPDPQLRQQLGTMLADPETADTAFATLARWAEVEDAAREAERRKSGTPNA